MRVEIFFASHKERKERKIQKKREEVEREAKQKEKEKRKAWEDPWERKGVGEECSFPQGHSTRQKI